MAKPIFEHSFKNGLRVDVYEEGFTLWDDRAGPRWVVDASCVADDNNFQISDQHFQRAKYKGMNPTIPAFYKPRKRPSRKKVKRVARS